MNFSGQKLTTFDRHGDKIEVILRSSNFVKIYQKEVSINDKKGLEGILSDLKNKGVDFIGLIKRGMLNDSEWFS